MLFSIVDAPICIPTDSVEGFCFLHTFSNIICRFFNNGHSDWCEVVTHCSLDLHFSNNLLMWNILSCGDCSHEIKRHLLLGRKVMTNLDSICKSRDITLPTKVCLVKAMVFTMVMYGCESWTVKKADH